MAAIVNTDMRMACALWSRRRYHAPREPARSSFPAPRAGDSGKSYEVTSSRFLALALTALAASAPAAPAAQTAAAAPIALHPENPHYFLWRGRPTILITSAEHYGAVINLDFDYRKYLDTLAADGMNYTRVFSGAYVEPQGAFKIERNTLAPGPGRFLAPWARASQPGYPNGGNKFDLSRWDDAYFARLKDFVSRAAARNIVVELSLFCPMYEEVQWSLSPMNRANNVNGVGGVGRNEVYTLDKEPALLAVQEGLTRKLVTELNASDNLFFEIANEPYFGGVTMAWQHRIADVIVETERALPAKHLIAQNIANKSAKIASPHPAVSIFNFHYASPPETVAMNYGLNKAIGDDETGFRGVSDESTGWRRGTSSSPAAGCTTISITRSLPATRTGRSSTRRHSPAAAARRCGAS